MAMAQAHARKVTTMLVGQMADVAGFDLAHGNALDAVSDVMLKFIEEVASTSKEYAELQGRSDVNALDVVRGSRMAVHRSSPDVRQHQEV